MFNIKGNKKGFTLIELIVVMAIIGILVLLATPKFLNYIKDANVTALQADVKVLGDGGMYHYIRHDNTYPVEIGSDGKSVEIDLDSLKTAGLAKGQDSAVYENVLKEYYYETLGVTEDKADPQLKWDQVKGLFKFSKFDQQEMAEHIRNTRSHIQEFYLITQGPMQGEVVYNRVLENSIGEDFIGLIGVDIPATE